RNTVRCCAFGSVHIAGPLSIAGIKSNALAIVFEAEAGEGKPEWFVLGAGSRRKRLGNFRVIESRIASASCRINKNELVAVLGCDAVPKAIVWKPCRPHSRVQDQWVGVIAHELLSVRVVCRGECSCLCEA